MALRDFKRKTEPQKVMLEGGDGTEYVVGTPYSLNPLFQAHLSRFTAADQVQIEAARQRKDYVELERISHENAIKAAVESGCITEIGDGVDSISAKEDLIAYLLDRSNRRLEQAVDEALKRDNTAFRITAKAAVEEGKSQQPGADGGGSVQEKEKKKAAKD